MLLTKGANDDTVLVESLKSEVQALESQCNMLEKLVKDLQSRCDTQEGYLETFRLEIVNFHRNEGTLDLSCQGEELELEAML